MQKHINSKKTRIVLRIAALASIKKIAKTPAVQIMNDMILKNSFFELKKIYIAKGILKAIEAAVIFLLPANPLIAITLNPCSG